MALEADRNHVTVAGLEAERSRHLDVPAKRINAELLYPNISNCTVIFVDNIWICDRHTQHMLLCLNRILLVTAAVSLLN